MAYKKLGMRLFIGVLVPPALRSSIADVQRAVAEVAAVKLVEPENLHFALKFLGEVPEEAVAKLKEILERVCSRFAAFELHIAGLSAFPSIKYVRVVWLGAKEGAKELSALNKAIETEITAAGFRREPKPFTPHLTIGRVKAVRDKAALRRVFEERANIDIGTMRVTAATLFESRLTRTGPVYRELYSAQLR
jgi:2'-5' RNA ligase